MPYPTLVKRLNESSDTAKKKVLACIVPELSFRGIIFSILLRVSFLFESKKESEEEFEKLESVFGKKVQPEPITLSATQRMWFLLVKPPSRK